MWWRKKGGKIRSLLLAHAVQGELVPAANRGEDLYGRPCEFTAP